MSDAAPTLATKVAKMAEVGGSTAAGVPLAQKYLFGLSPDEWTLIFGAIGALVALLGFAVNWAYQHRRTQAYIAHLASARKNDPDE